MGESEQANFRVPAGGRDLMSRVARGLREDPSFADRLRRFLAGDAAPQDRERLAAIEEQLAAVEERLATIESGTAARKPSKAAPSPVSSRWVSGSGNGRRLTVEGEAELERMVRDGRTNGEIAKALGIRAYAVDRKRRHLDAAAAAEDWDEIDTGIEIRRIDPARQPSSTQ